MCLGMAWRAFADDAAPVTTGVTVSATIAPADKGSCVVRATVTDSESKTALATPQVFLAAGEDAKVSSTVGERKIEIKVKAAEACEGGTY